MIRLSSDANAGARRARAPHGFPVFSVLLVSLMLILSVDTVTAQAREIAPSVPAIPAATGASLPAPDDRSADLPFRGEIRRDRLENGLEYFAVEHPFPENKVVLRLVVDAGSVMETEEQSGLAHFIEHMAFNGTEDFGETELVAYLESLGIQFGPDVNAYTSFNETVYKLEIPANDPEALRSGFRVMEQWASALTFEPEAIERERGVITEEWRGNRGAATRMLEDHIPVLLAGSRYAERLPIGSIDIIQNAPREEFLAYYQRWYRPDNMAMIAVGDLPVERLEELVHDSMASIPRPSTPLHRPYHFVPMDDPAPRVSIATDTEAARSTVSLYAMAPPPPEQTIGDYRQALVRSLFAAIINERVRDRVRDVEEPVTSGGIGFNRFLRGTEIAVSAAVVRENRALEAFQLIATEIERAYRFGVLPEELDRAGRRFLQSIEEAEVNFPSRHSASLADELVRHWIEGEPVPGIAFEAAMYRALIPGISPEEVSAVAERFTRGRSTVILASLRVDDAGNLPDGSPVPTEEQFLQILEAVRSTPLAPPERQSDETTILETLPQPGTVVEQITHGAVGTQEFLLSNGMRVYVKSTDFREDEIVFSATSPGGLALVDTGLVTAARLAASVAAESGIGGLDAGALERALAGRSAGITPSLGRVTEGLSGSTRREDLELLFQLIHAAFTAPRFDPSALANVQQQTIQQIADSRATPTGRYSRRLQELFAGGDPRLEPLTEAAVSSVTVDQIREVYRERFAAPSEFALFFVGSVEPETIATLAERYLASIPGATPADESGPVGNARGFRESIPAERYPRPQGVVSDTVFAGQEPVARFVSVIHGPYEWSQRENHLFNSVSDLLDIRLREEIREAAGGAYSVGAGGWRWRDPQPWAFMQIAFGLDPDRVDELRARAMEIVEEVRTTTPSPEYVERIQAQQRDSYQQSIQENGYWNAVLSFAVENGRDLATIMDYPDLIESLDGEAIRATAARYLSPERRIELTLLPEAARR